MSEKKKTKIAPYKLRKNRDVPLFYYRTRITLVSLAIFGLTWLNSPPWYTWSLAFVGYMTSIIVLDFLVYTVCGYKESRKIRPKELMWWQGMTPKALDMFIATMVNMRRLTYGIALVSIIMDSRISYLNPFVLSDGMIVLIMGRIVCLFYLVNIKRLPIPLGYADALKEAQKNGAHSGFPQRRSTELRPSTMDNAFYTGTGVITYRRR